MSMQDNPANSEGTSALGHFVLHHAAHLPQKLVDEADAAVWAGTDCLSCAACCKTRSPVYSDADVQRIASHLGMAGEEFRQRYLLNYCNGDWVNMQHPCPFLEEDNRCSIYEVRPQNCADFPYHNARPFAARRETFSRNVDLCPATAALLRRLRERFDADVAPPPEPGQSHQP